MARKRKTLEEQLSQLEEKKKALQARIQKQERAKETRRKILIGALVLDRMGSDRDPEFARRLTEWLRRELPGFLTRQIDRNLFEDLIVPDINQAKESQHE